MLSTTVHRMNYLVKTLYKVHEQFLIDLKLEQKLIGALYSETKFKLDVGFCGDLFGH